MPTTKIPWLGQMVEVDLVMIRPAVGDKPALYLYGDAAYAFAQMDAAARAAGIKLEVNTAFRDHEYQKRLYAQYQADKAAGKSPAVVAKPGTSDHERGLSIDINTGVPADKRTASPEVKASVSPVYRWMHQNAGRFGFKNDVASEPWHWTFQVSVINVAAAAKAAGGGMAMLLLAGAALWLTTRRG